MPWGSTNVNETGSQAGSPVRAKETSRLSTAASGEMLSTILRRGQSGLSLAVVAAAWWWAGESAWVVVWVLPLAAEWLWAVQA